MAAVLQIRLFGGLHAGREDAPLAGFVSHKVTALLAYLVVTGRPHNRDTLAALLWGEMSDVDAKNNLRQALSNLRKAIDPHLIITRDTVSWNADTPYHLDTLAFEQYLQAGRDVDLERRAAAFRQAAALYRGDFLAGFFVRDAPEFEEWMLAQRVRYRELALHALHTVTECHLSRGEYGRAIDAATRLLALDAWREEAHRQLMLAQARSGQRSAALAQYETCRLLLEQELGVQPSAETTALYERIRGAIHRVQLPPEITPFVGRTGELAQIVRMLANPAVRLITLSGPGGSGKTRLAREAAARVADTFLHGVCFVPLAAVDSFAVVPSTIADALGLVLSGNSDPGEQLLVYLSDKELLLVLDNLEHLAGADAWVSRLTQACPEVRLLSTSRERLNLRGERLLELAGLDQPPHSQDGDITPYSATQLFLNTARETTPDFILDAGNEPAVAHICRLVHGLPLAIELAAAWVRHLTCQEIAAEIEQNLSFLATTQKNVPERHRSLQAAFEHSWSLLTEEERAAFARLSVFRGGCTREAATAVTQAPFPVFAALNDKSLLRRDPAGRYTIHELLRQYAENKLQADPQSFVDTQERHCRFYAGFLAAREDAQNDERQNETWPEIAADIDNIRAAWKWAVAAQRPELLEPALESLRASFEHFGLYNEAAGLFEAAASTARAVGGEHSPSFGRLLLRQAWFYHRMDRFETARPLIEQSLDILRQAQPSLPAEEALGLQCLGNMARMTGDYEQSMLYYRHSLQQYRLVGNPRTIASSLNGLAIAYNELGEFAEARTLFEECLAIRREIGDRRGMATALVNLGFAAMAEGRYGDAQRFTRGALAIFRGISYPMGVAVTLNNLGVAAYWLGNYVEARALLQECLLLCRELGHRHIAAHALSSLGGVAGGLDEYNEAWQLIGEGLLTAREIRSISATLYGVLTSALLLSRAEQWEAAVELAGLVLFHAQTNQEGKYNAKKLLTHLREQLPEPLFISAEEKGRMKELDEAVSEILEQFPTPKSNFPETAG